MLKVGLIGLGAMGNQHLEHYERLQNEGFPLRLVAICDSDPEKLKSIERNEGNGVSNRSLAECQLLTELDAMLELDLDLRQTRGSKLLSEELTPESTRITINIVEAEELSAKQKGKTIVIR